MTVVIDGLAGGAQLLENAGGGQLSELQTEVLTVLQAAGGSPLRARQVLACLPGRGPASKRAVAAALRHLHAAGLASRRPDECGVWLYTAAARSFSASPGAPRSLGTLLGLGPLETAIMQVTWEAMVPLTIAEILAELGYPPARYTTVSTVAGILCGKHLLLRARTQPGPATGTRGRRSWEYRPAQTFSEYAGDLIAALLDHVPHPAAALAHALASTPAGPRAGIRVEGPPRQQRCNISGARQP